MQKIIRSQVKKYLVVGVSSNAIDILCFNLLLALLDHPIVSSVIAALVSTGLNIWANRRFTFQTKGAENWLSGYFRLILATALLISLQTMLFWGISRLIAQSDVIALNLLRAASVALISGIRFIVFRKLIGSSFSN